MLTNPLKYREYMHYGIIADMPGLSQVFEHVNIDDTLERSSILSFENILDYQKIYAITCDCPFIAEIHHSAKVWVSYT